AALGVNWDMAELLKTGERIWNLKRLYNLRLGWSPRNEKLPKLLLQPLHDGGQEGNVPNMTLMLAEYYQFSGWQPTSGYPLAEKLRELDLDRLVSATPRS
ncbi:MAG: aldehyde ferredoxin oxidoreductase C-terminal domain-containing protein, partial [Chloroflexota bacterium]